MYQNLIFGLQERTIRNNSNVIILFQLTLRDVENIDLSYEEFKDLCREAWKDEDYNYLYFDRSKKQNEGNSIVNDNRKLLLNVFQELILSKIIFISKIFVQLKITMI